VVAGESIKQTANAAYETTANAAKTVTGGRGDRATGGPTGAAYRDRAGQTVSLLAGFRSLPQVLCSH
jgi:hypothetical protein